MSPMLSVKNLQRNYGDVVALGPISMTIKSGSAVALLGHNGSGKSTLLRIISGLLEPTDGEVTVAGFEPGSIEARQAVSYVADQPVFYDDLSVWEHLEMVARLHGATDWEQRAADLLGELGIYDRADDLPVRFSRGLRQKAALAIGLVRPFQLLLVDEPFVGLDSQGKQAFISLLGEAIEGGSTVLVATHELGFLERVERCIGLRSGDIMYDGTPIGFDPSSLLG